MAKPIKTVSIEIPVGRIPWLKQQIPYEIRYMQEAPALEKTASAYIKQSIAEYELLLKNLEKHAKV